MKMVGGYLPPISGRPSDVLEKIPLPDKLYIDLERHRASYTPLVAEGQEIEAGDPLAETASSGGTLVLPSPANGKIVTIDSERHRLVLETRKDSSPARDLGKFEPHRIDDKVMRDALAKGGVWPYFWSSQTGSMPDLSGAERPRAIVINAVFTEPFRARGKVILQHTWDRIVRGIRFLPRLMADYGTVEFVLTCRDDPVVRMLSVDTSGYAWIRFHHVPLLYPIENPRVLTRALRKADRSLAKDDTMWVIDIQGIEALGSLLDEGVTLGQRVVVVGGPGATDPRHLNVRIGTPISALLSEKERRDSMVLRGGLFNGVPVDPDTAAVQPDDDGFFLLPRESEREFLSFIQPGFRKTSILSCYASRITGARDSHISTSLRGELRPCIACGLCEKVCPMHLMPQILHRYLYAGMLDDVEAAGLNLCVDCRLCTYVCPSKIEIQKELSEAKEQLRLEKEASEPEPTT